MAAWFNKKAAREMAKMAENLKAESQARAEAEENLKAEIENKAAMERKIKAEAEKMLITQYNRYTVMVEKAETKAKEAMETARAQVKESEEKIQSYEVALIETQKKLREAKEQLNAEAFARAEAEEKLRSESDERKKLKAQVEDMVAAAGAKAEENVQSYEAELTNVQAKLIEAKGQAKQKAIANTEEDNNTRIKKRRKFLEQPLEEVYTIGRKRLNIFHLGNIKRKFILLLVLAIFTVLTFALSKTKDPPAAEPGGVMIEESTPEQITLVGSDTDSQQLESDVAADASLGSLEAPAPGITNAPSLNYKSSDNIRFKFDEARNVTDSDTQFLTITAHPEPLKITASASGKNNIVQFSDDKRLETRVGSKIYYDFSDVTIGASAVIRTVVLFVEHFEEEQFAEGKLEWAIGTGWPARPAVWAVTRAPVHQGESSEAVDAWDITSVVDTVEKINAIQLQIKNDNKSAKCKTFVDNAYVVIECQ